MLKRTICAILAALMITTLVVGCGGKESDNTPASSATAVSTAAASTEQQTQKAVNEWDKMKEEEHQLDITLTPGYLTEELWTELLDGFQKDHPKWKITREKNPEAGKQDQAKILAGNAPGFFQGDWQNFTSHQALNAGVLADVEDLLSAPAYDIPDKTVGETMLPGFDNVMTKDGKRYLFCARYGTNGVWINKKMFDENGWKVPKTWDEFTALCEQIKAKNITPMIFTGTYAPYPFNMFLYPMICDVGQGQQTAKDLANLVPGAWNSSYAKTSLQRFVSMYDKGYFTKDVLGTDYTQAQVLFFQGKAAMVLSGSWLEAEMKDQIPEGFEFEFIAPPGIDSAGKEKMIPIFTVGFMFSKGAKQEKEAKELVRYWYSSKFMQSYAEKMGEPTITQAFAQPAEDKFSKAAWSIKKAIEDPSAKIISLDFTSWYPTIHKVFSDGAIGIIAGNETVDGLLQKAEAEAEKVRKDPNIVKYTQD
ncbi:MAG: extracellular solute-binding protein [Clostridiaceae bacterium]